jgi:hypothetical protein
MDLKLGYTYRKRKDLVNEDGNSCRSDMCFGIEEGIFFGRSGTYWPMFNLGNGKECAINLTDECFEEVK